MGSSVDPCSYLVSLNLEEFIIGKGKPPPIMSSSSNLDDHHDLFIKTPPSPSDTKPPAYNDVWNDHMMHNCGLRGAEEDFLQNAAPMMTKIDQEYLNWQQQQQEMVDGMKMMQTADFRVFDESKVAIATKELVVVENSGLEMEKRDGGDELIMKDEMVMKSVERRQKRMIKNRESAARSRARKQVNLLLILIN